MAGDKRRVPRLLDDLGHEITGVVTPVSICMLLTVVLVRLLNPDGDSPGNAVGIATIAYNEASPAAAQDSESEKFTGALLNAVIFVGIIFGMTALLLLFFWLRWMKVIYGYMCFAIFDIFFLLLGALLIKLLQLADWSWDAVSFAFGLFNVSVVAVVAALGFLPVPIHVKQGYMVAVGVIVSFIFTYIPEWTSWILLVLMALYDLYAVLAPHGPLKWLVNLASDRQDPLPALVYETRARDPAQQGVWRRRAGGARQDDAGAAQPTTAAAPAPGTNGDAAARAPVGGAGSDAPSAADETAPLAPARSTARDAGDGTRRGGWGEGREGAAGSVVDGNTVQWETSRGAQRRDVAAAGGAAGEAAAAGSEGGESDPDFGLGMDGLKLGLGDFIFYSMMVGRAAMFDMMTVYACYLGVVAGLVGTLLLLATFKKALPALPISIALGVVFYFLVRLVLEQLLVPMSKHLVFV